MRRSYTTVKQGRFGRCVVAEVDLPKESLIAKFDGSVYEADKCTDLAPDIADHAIQFEEHKWKDSWGSTRLMNHSCEPNCGIRGAFEIVAMRDIRKGEELTFDYEMTEDSDWRLTCLCGTPSCRGVIGTFSQMPKEVRQKLQGFISKWLVEKYQL